LFAARNLVEDARMEEEREEAQEREQTAGPAARQEPPGKRRRKSEPALLEKEDGVLWIARRGDTEGNSAPKMEAVHLGPNCSFKHLLQAVATARETQGVAVPSASFC
jgi:hypothetical protein